MPDLTILSLRGGLNDSDRPSNLDDDQCMVANNVEFYYAALGERRLGCTPIDITDSDLDAETTPVLMAERNPDNDIFHPEHWAVVATPGVSVSFAYEIDGVWTPVTPTDACIPDVPAIYHLSAQALNGKLFFAYPSSEDRLHVWDGTTLRRTGLTQPLPPTAVDA